MSLSQVRREISSTLSVPRSRFPGPRSLLPIPDSLFPIRCSRPVHVSVSATDVVRHGGALWQLVVLVYTATPRSRPYAGPVIPSEPCDPERSSLSSRASDAGYPRSGCVRDLLDRTRGRSGYDDLTVDPSRAQLRWAPARLRRSARDDAASPARRRSGAETRQPRWAS